MRLSHVIHAVINSSVNFTAVLDACTWLRSIYIKYKSETKLRESRRGSTMTYDDMKDVLEKSHFFQAKMKHHKCKPPFWIQLYGDPGVWIMFTRSISLLSDLLDDNLIFEIQGNTPQQLLLEVQSTLNKPFTKVTHGQMPVMWESFMQHAVSSTQLVLYTHSGTL